MRKLQHGELAATIPDSSKSRIMYDHCAAVSAQANHGTKDRHRYATIERALSNLGSPWSRAGASSSSSFTFFRRSYRAAFRLQAFTLSLRPQVWAACHRK